MHWFLFYSAFTRRNAVISTLMSQKNGKIHVCTNLMNRWSIIASIHPRVFLLWRAYNALQNITNITLQSSLVLKNYLDKCIHDDCCIPTMHTPPVYFTPFLFPRVFISSRHVILMFRCVVRILRTRDLTSISRPSGRNGQANEVPGVSVDFFWGIWNGSGFFDWK